MRWVLGAVALLAGLLAIYIGYGFVDNFDPDSVRGKRVLVTGASAGIGEQLAYQYARLGASVVITARTESKLQQVVKKCQMLGLKTAHFSYVTADMSDLKQTSHVVQTAVDKMGDLDVLVLNHIANYILLPWESRKEDLDWLHKTMDVNFFSYVHLASEALPHLERSGGSLVVVSSVAGKKSIRGLTAYSSSKFALEGFFDGLRQELTSKDSTIAVTLCILGIIGTESAKQFRETNQLKESKLEDPADAALAILKGGMGREPEIYYPYHIKAAFVWLKSFSPRFLDYLVKDAVATSS